MQEEKEKIAGGAARATGGTPLTKKTRRHRRYLPIVIRAGEATARRMKIEIGRTWRATGDGLICLCPSPTKAKGKKKNKKILRMSFFVVLRTPPCLQEFLANARLLPAIFPRN